MAIPRDLMIRIGWLMFVIVGFNVILAELMTDYGAEPIADPLWIDDYNAMSNFTETAKAQQDSALKDVPIVGAVIEVWQHVTAAIRLVGSTFNLFLVSVDSFLAETLKMPKLLVNFLEAILIVAFAFIIISALRKYKT